jgi:hypothetical protein
VISGAPLFVAVTEFRTTDVYTDWLLTMLEHKVDKAREAKNEKVALGI